MNSRKIIFLSSIAFIFITLSLLIIYQNPSSGYELSIYKSTPWIFWILLFISYFIGFSTLLHQSKINAKLWMISAFILIMCNIIFLYLHVLKGYGFYGRADNLSHLGAAIDICNNGHIGIDNFYPMVHILISIISLFSNTEALIIMKFLAGFFSILFIFNMYLLASVIYHNQNEILITTTSSFILFFGSFFLEGYHLSSIPNSITDFIYPIILYLYLKRNKMNYRILLTIFILSISFFHPLTTLSLLIVFFAFEFASFTNKNVQNKISFSLRPTLILLIAFLTWTLSFGFVTKTIKRLLLFLNNEAKTSPATDTINIIEKLGFSGIDLVEFLFKLYGQNVIFFTIALFSLVIIFRRKNEYKEYLSLHKVCYAFILLCGVFLLLFVVPLSFNQYRWMSYLSIFSVLISTIFFTRIEKMNLYPLIVLIIFISAIMGVANLYNSPYKSQPNQQITSKELKGFEWFLETKNPEIKVSSIQSVSFFRFADGLLGISVREQRQDISKDTSIYGDFEAVLPDNLNQKNSTYLGTSLSENRYVHFSEYDRLLYTEVWPRVGRYTKSDFIKFNSDISATKFYSNGDLDLYLVNKLSTR